MWDLGISDHGDLVVTGHRDLAGKSGTDLLEQRMIIRLKIMRGSWIYDDDGSLGSNLHHVIGSPSDKAAQTIPAYVRDALRPMSKEVSIADVQVTTDGITSTLVVFYRVADVNPDTAAQQFAIALPLVGGA